MAPGIEPGNLIRSTLIRYPPGPFYSACRRRGGVLNSPRFCFFFFFYFFSVSEVGAALMGDTAGTNRVSRPKHGV